MQQSAPTPQLLPVEEKSLKQFSDPQTKSPSHCVSLSQSPSPNVHGTASEQQFQFVDGSPLQLFPGSCTSTALVESATSSNNLNILCSRF